MNIYAFWTWKYQYLITTLHSKLKDSHVYLQSTSCHNSKLIADIQRTMVLPFRKICSWESKYSEKSKEYVAYLVIRGHTQKKVKSVFTKIGKMARSEYRM